MSEHLDDVGQTREQWIEAFKMELNDKDEWSWSKFVDDHHEQAERYEALRLKWNKFVGEYNGVVAPRHRNFGRPLAASDSQRADVRKRRKAGQSLREIAEDTNLGLRTVRTIVDKADGLDRGAVARLERIAPDRLAEARERRLRRLRVSLPRRINDDIKRGAELRKQAKGLLKG
jgi:hypothetical protein